MATRVRAGDVEGRRAFSGAVLRVPDGLQEDLDLVPDGELLARDGVHRIERRVDLAELHITACDRSDFGDFVGLANLGVADNDLLEFGSNYRTQQRNEKIPGSTALRFP